MGVVKIRVGADCMPLKPLPDINMYRILYENRSWVYSIEVFLN